MTDTKHPDLRPVTSWHGRNTRRDENWRQTRWDPTRGSERGRAGRDFYSLRKNKKLIRIFKTILIIPTYLTPQIIKFSIKINQFCILLSNVDVMHLSPGLAHAMVSLFIQKRNISVYSLFKIYQLQQSQVKTIQLCNPTSMFNISLF